MARLEQGYDFSQEMRTWVSPSLIEANHILSLSQQELQAAIEMEMAENPALELESRPTCPRCNSVLDGNWCSTCNRSVEVQERTQSLDSMDDYDARLAPSSPTDGEAFDPITIVASRLSPLDQLHADARMSLHEDDFPIAVMIIDSLDERGFLTMSIEDIAEPLGMTPDDVEEVLAIIQSIAPVGVGARDLRECLMLQIDYLKSQNAELPEKLELIVSDHLDALGAHKFGAIQKATGIAADELDDIREYLRTHLNPFPLQSVAAQTWQEPSESGHVTPDVMIDIIDDQLVVSIADNRFFHLRTNRLYEQLSKEFSGGSKQQKDEPQPEMDQEENSDRRPSAEEETDDLLDAEIIANASGEDKTHVRRYTQRAQSFMNNIEQRRTTLLRISESICHFQEAFLRDGVRSLRPLTRSVVAQEVGVHESTVSRATSNKFVQLPNRKVIPFSDFFTPSLSVKDVLKEIVERETAKGEALTDKRIVELLQDEGIRIARRTVAKYRAELGILPSTMR